MLNKITNTAIKAAFEAGKLLKEGFGTTFDIASKDGSNNLVTEYDHLSENLIIKIIKNEISEQDHLFLAEESGNSGNGNDNSILWIIDPLDGTVNFAHSIPIFSVSIAALVAGEIVSAAIYQPMLNEMFCAEKGKGAYLNGRKIQVSKTDDFYSSMLVTGFPYNVNHNPCNCIEHFVSIIQNGIPVRRLGSAALDLAYVAAGRFDGFWEIDLKPWDVAAGLLIIEEAGGTISKYDNSPYKPGDRSLLATNGLIHRAVSDTLSNCNSVLKKLNIEIPSL